MRAGSGVWRWIGASDLEMDGQPLIGTQKSEIMAIGAKHVF